MAVGAVRRAWPDRLWQSSELPCLTPPPLSQPSAAFLTQTVCLDDVTVKFEIWDTAGQERYHSLAPMYYRGAQAAIVVYDVTNTDTFARAKNWVKELQRQANPNIVIALAGNKADLASKRAIETDVSLGASLTAAGPGSSLSTAHFTAVSRPFRPQCNLIQEAAAYAEENGLLFMETSAKTAMNVNEIFMAIGECGHLWFRGGRHWLICCIHHNTGLLLSSHWPPLLSHWPPPILLF